VRHTAGEGILKDLLKAQEFEDGEIDSGMQTQSAFVWTESRVELHTVALVDVALPLIILPDHTELDDALGNRDDLEGLFVLWVLLEDS
jgi:hypothetical protein